MKDIYDQRIDLRHAAAGMFLTTVAMDMYSDPWPTASDVGRWVVTAGLLAVGLWHFRRCKQPAEPSKPTPLP